jgi:hypothetical protein
MAATKQQKEIIALLVLLAIVALVWHFYVGKGGASAGNLSAGGNYEPLNAEDYSKVFSGMEQARATEYKATGRNIFVAGAVPVAAGPGGAAVAPKPKRPIWDQPQPPPEPPPPVLGMKLFGLGALPSNGPRRAFLQDGEEVRIVGEGDTIQNHIRIIHIGNDRIEYEDINTGKKNSTTLEMPPSA